MILIVDDNPDNIFSLKTLLSLHHFSVDTASSGAEALKKVLQNSYSLVILDVQMPDMDGFEVAEAMAGYSASRDIPVIFLSAVNTQKKFVTRGYSSGGVDYVTKPFDPDILLLKVKTFYRLSEQNRKLNELERSLRKEIELRKEAEVVLEQRVKERTAELKESNHQLVESNKELAQFAFVASHDLQEPLRKIQVFSSMAISHHGKDESKVLETLNKIHTASERLRNLIKDLLKYSQINEEKVFIKTDLNRIIEETVSDLELLSSTSRSTIHTEDLPEVEVIPSEIRQVFQNIISNAIKFSKPGEPCVITIRGERIQKKSFDAPAVRDGDYCRISITDNGIGFAEEHVDKIFEIFRRLNSREHYEGNGIGLAIVKKVIERHNGIVTAESKENEGTTFIFVLPLTQQQTEKKSIPA